MEGGVAAQLRTFGKEARGGILGRILRGEVGFLQVFVALALIWTIFQLANDRFLTAVNLTNLMLQVTAIGIISIGVVLVLLLGEIDLSIGAVSGLCAGIMAVLTVQHGWSPELAILVGLLAGTAIGLINGFFNTFFGIPVVRGDARGADRLAGSVTPGAGRYRHDQPPAQRHHRPDQHVLRRRGRMDPRRGRDGRHAGSRAARTAPPPTGRPGTAGTRRDRVSHRARRCGDVHRGRDPALRSRSAAGGHHPARPDRDLRVHHRQNPVRQAHLRRRRQRRGGSARRDPGHPGPGHGLRDRLDDGGGRRDHGRVATDRRQPVIGFGRRPAQRDRRPGDRGHQPVRRPRHGLVGSARGARDRVDLERHQPARTGVVREVHDHRRRPARRGDARRPRAGASGRRSRSRSAANRAGRRRRLCSA